MMVTVHQPTYLPYLGVISKIAAAQTFVVYDTAQYDKGSTHSRQRIRTAQGWCWISIPLKSSLTPFIETEISYEDKVHPWYQKHWKSIAQSYVKTPFFHTYANALEEIYMKSHPPTLGAFNNEFITFLLAAFKIKRHVEYFSGLNIPKELSPSEKLAEAVRRVNGTHYLSGPSGKKYLDMAPFTERGITVSFTDFVHPIYPQYHSRYDEQFIPNMGSIDALFNVGRLPVA